MVQVSFISFVFLLTFHSCDIRIQSWKQTKKGIHVYSKQVLPNQPNPAIFATQNSREA